MNSPAPNILGAVSAMSPFTEYIMNKLELEATSEDDISARDKTLDAIFAEDHALGVGGGATTTNNYGNKQRQQQPTTATNNNNNK